MEGQEIVSLTFGDQAKMENDQLGWATRTEADAHEQAREVESEEMTEFQNVTEPTAPVARQSERDGALENSLSNNHENEMTQSSGKPTETNLLVEAQGDEISVEADQETELLESQEIKPNTVEEVEFVEPSDKEELEWKNRDPAECKQETPASSVMVTPSRSPEIRDKALVLEELEAEKQKMAAEKSKESLKNNEVGGIFTESSDEDAQTAAAEKGNKEIEKDNLSVDEQIWKQPKIQEKNEEDERETLPQEIKEALKNIYKLKLLVENLQKKLFAEDARLREMRNRLLCV